MDRLSEIINDIRFNSSIFGITHFKPFTCNYIYVILQWHNTFPRNVSNTSESEITQALQQVKVMLQFLALHLFNF